MDKGVYELCEKINKTANGTDCSYYAHFPKEFDKNIGICEKKNIICYEGKIFDGYCYLFGEKIEVE